MRKTIITVSMLCALGASTMALDTGCNSAWWQSIQNNPALGVQEFEAGVGIAVEAAQLAWPAILAAIPAANQAAASQQFQNALQDVNHGLQVLNDAVAAAIDAQQSSPNFTALMQAVTDAVSQVVAIVDQYMGAQPAPAATDGGTAVAMTSKVPAAAAAAADMHAAYHGLSRWGVKVK